MEAKQWQSLDFYAILILLPKIATSLLELISVYVLSSLNFTPLTNAT